MVRHISSIAEIVEDIEASVRFYRDGLGLAVEYEPGSAYAVVSAPGVLHFGLWTRPAAAETLFGDANAAARIPLGFFVEFEVDRVAESQRQFEEKGWPVAQPEKQESWGQTTSRLLTPGGALCGLTETPWARRLAAPLEAKADNG